MCMSLPVCTKPRMHRPFARRESCFERREGLPSQVDVCDAALIIACTNFDDTKPELSNAMVGVTHPVKSSGPIQSRSKWAVWRVLAWFELRIHHEDSQLSQVSSFSEASPISLFITFFHSSIIFFIPPGAMLASTTSLGNLWALYLVDANW